MGWLDDMAKRLAGAAREEERRKAFEQAMARPKALDPAERRAAADRTQPASQGASIGQG